MQLLAQERDYACVLTSIAMCTGIDAHDLANQVTHDPEKLYDRPKIPVPMFRGYQIEDFPHILSKYGWCMIPYIRYANVSGVTMYFECPVSIIHGKTGLLTFPEQRHVTAWDGERIYDPKGLIYEINYYWSEFWWIRKL